MPLKERLPEPARTIISAFPDATPDTIALISGMLDDITALKESLLATQVTVIDLQGQVDYLESMLRLTGDE
mgnify:CR=1 FL=1